MNSSYLLELALHQLWLGAAFAGLVYALTRWRRWSAESRYWVWTATLVVVAALPLLGQLPLPQLPGLPELAPDTHSETIALLDPGSADVAGPPGNAAVPPLEEAGVDWIAVLAVLWTLGFSWRLYALLAGTRTLRRWAREATPIPAQLLPVTNEALAHCEVRESASANVPMVVGFARPVILTPAGLHTRLPSAQFAMVLQHEAAHARRGDGWLLLLQRLIEAAYFYNPVVHLIARRVERERECSCDDRALGEAQGLKVEYADCLIAISRDALKAGAPTLAVGAVRRASEVCARVERLLSHSQANPTRLNPWHVGLACSVLMLAGALSTLVMPRAQAEPVRSLVSRSLARELAESALSVEQAQQLVGAGADVNYVLRGDGTPLILAARRGDVPMVKFLLENGAEIERSASGDGNPLIVASAAGHMPVVSLLVGRGADVNAFDAYDESPLINAARGGHMPVVDYLLEHGADVNLTVQSQTVQGIEERSALGEARKSGHTAVVERLLASGARP